MLIGPYEVLGTIGKGGGGVVYRVRRDGRELALKLLHRSEGEALARFERERRLLESLGEADGFVTLLDAGSSPSGPYLVMPFVSGGTLRSKLDAGPLAIDEVIDLGQQLATALGTAHARGIVHRDMKPENVLFTAAGHPLIADLGIAKHFDADAPGGSRSVGLSRTGEGMGTAGYMAPEQLASAKTVRPAADVFALGAILYECLAGGPCFTGESVMEVLARVSTGSFVPLRKRRAETPAWLALVIERSLAREPEDRPGDGFALARALAAGAPRTHRRVFAVILIALAIVGVTATILTRKKTAPLPPRATASLLAPVDRNKAAAMAVLETAGTAMQQGDLDAAIAGFTRATELDPGLADAWNDRGAARLEKNDLEGALADFTRTIELDATRGPNFYNRSVVRSALGNQEGAIADLSRALELDPKQPMWWRSRGQARASAGDLDGAIDDFTRALGLDPALVAALNDRAAARVRKGDAEGATRDYEAFLERAPGDPEATAVRAALARLRGR